MQAMLAFTAAMMMAALAAPSSLALSSQTEDLLYPYKTDLTSIDKHQARHEQVLPFRLPFFGSRYNKLWLNRDGYISFEKGELLFTNIQAGDNLASIAPFFAYQVPKDGGGVYLGFVNMMTERNASLRNRIATDFADGMIGAEGFQPRFVIIATWSQMGPNFEPADSTDHRLNTYQVVLATDEVRTYAMLNYAQLQWVSRNESSHRAYVGFFAGHLGRSFEFRPYSQRPNLSLLPGAGYGNQMPGRFFFQVDEQMVSGSCVNADHESRVPLTFRPVLGSMLGGTVVNITGPCLKPTDHIECIFDNVTAKAVYRDANHASCVQPAVMTHGQVSLYVRVNGKSTSSGQYYIESPDLIESLHVVQVSNDRLETEPEKLTIRWVPEVLASRKANISVQISLWGYREANDSKLTFITTLVRSVPLHQGSLNISLATSRLEATISNITDITFGFIQVNLTDPIGAGNFTTSPALWSKPIPLAWYFSQQWAERHGVSDNWPKHFCEQWLHEEAPFEAALDDVAQCPCNVNQASIDRGRFIPHPECNVIVRNCRELHGRALQCFKTARPSASGAVQTCCYDDYGELVQTADTMYGGRPSRTPTQRKHSSRTSPLSEYLNDVVPFYFCCKWQSKGDDADSCAKFKERRPSHDCTNYQTPRVASMFGDPHVNTVDNVDYVFNAVGTHVLVNATGFELSADFEPLPRAQPNATQLRGVQIRERNSPVINISLRTSATSWYALSVQVDGQDFYWPQADVWTANTVDLDGVTLHQPLGIANMSQVFALFDSGVGVEVVANKRHLAVRFFAPQAFVQNASGLLVNNNHTATSNSSGPVAKLLPGHKRYAEMIEVCGNSLACQYDFALTFDPECAKVTRDEELAARWFQNEAHRKVVRCPALARPQNGFKSEARTWPGTVVRFTCKSGYKLVGSEARRCEEHGRWSAGVAAKCVPK